MTFSAEWDEHYRAVRQRTVWPFTDLVSLVKRFHPELRLARVLELGCGVGANAPFFVEEGARYIGIDGSAGAVVEAGRIAPSVAGDFTKTLPFEPGFDLVCDRAAVTHNDTAAIRSCLSLVHDLLKPGALYIGVDWFSHNHDEYANGDPDADEYTKTAYTEGQFANVGRVHFSDEGHLRDLFSRFELVHIEEKLVKRSTGIAATWNFVMRKPA